MARKSDRQKDAARQLAMAGNALELASKEAERERVLREHDLKVLNNGVDLIMKEQKRRLLSSVQKS
jgi:hypothetical protein